MVKKHQAIQFSSFAMYNWVLYCNQNIEIFHKKIHTKSIISKLFTPHKKIGIREQFIVLFQTIFSLFPSNGKLLMIEKDNQSLTIACLLVIGIQYRRTKLLSSTKN